MNHQLILPSLLSIALLQACGGGGGGGGGAAPAVPVADATSTPATPVAPATPAANANTGSVSAAFVPGTTPRYQLASGGSQTFGRLGTSVQAASGAMTTLDTAVLSGESVTKEITGDASYAMGRWVAGTVTRSSGAETLTGTDNRAYHYIVTNAPSQFPTTGSLTCDQGVFTAPTYTGGGPGGAVLGGGATGSASLSFSAAGAAVSGSINVTVGGASAAAPLNVTIATPASVAISGSYLNNGGSGAAIQIGEAGGGVFIVGGSYAAKLADGARYIGVARFRCA